MDYMLLKFQKGKIFLARTEKGLSCALFMRSQDEFGRISEYFRKKDIALRRNPEKFRLEKKLFARYFRGEKEGFSSLALDPVFGTPYQRKVWRAARKVPYGRTGTYKSLAHQLKHRGYRSVGQALARNPLLVVIPCHRVLNSDGGLGGFSAGLDLKKFLLRLEKAEVPA